MNKKALKEKLINKGLAEETVSFMFRALTASNRTLVEFDGKRSEVFNGPDGILNMKFRTNAIDIVGSFDEYSQPDTFIRITEPRAYWCGYSTKDQFEIIEAIKMADGSIYSTKAIPRKLGLFSPVVSYFSGENVAAYATENHERMEDKFDIIFDGEPDMIVNLKCQRMSYRTPFEPSVLMGLEREKTTVRMKHRG